MTEEKITITINKKDIHYLMNLLVNGRSIAQDNLDMPHPEWIEEEPFNEMWTNTLRCNRRLMNCINRATDKKVKEDE